MKSRLFVLLSTLAVAAAVVPANRAWSQIRSEPDAAIEKCLLEGTILEKTKTLKGVTHPELFAIECGGESRSVVFKSVDEYQRGVTQFEEGGWEVNFSDSYRYERVAYLLDRELGLNMVPVAVLRRVKRNDGALVEWIDDSSHEHEPKNPPTPQQMASLAHQKGSMRVFDALIYNVDRNISNWLVDDETWNLYLIDHSRSFRQTGELPKKFLEQRVRLSQTLYEKLKSLEEERLTALLGDLISVGQIRALLSRRDRILEKIDQDRQRYGEAVVFSG